LKSFSQTDTEQINLSNQTAKLVVKDLIRGDGCRQELEQTYMKISKLEERDIQKDSMIVFLKEKVSNQEFIISQKDGQITEFRDLSKKLENELNSQNNKIKWFRRGSIAGGACFILLLLAL
jgi:hypothetical protein